MAREVRELIIKSGSGSDELVIVHTGVRAGDARFTASLAMEHLTASVTFVGIDDRSVGTSASPPEMLSLDLFFASLAEAWRGWPGERSWTSLGGHLALTATHDGRANVIMLVEMRRSGDRPPPEWHARGELLIELGTLDALSRAAEWFERPEERPSVS